MVRTITLSTNQQFQKVHFLPCERLEKEVEETNTHKVLVGEDNDNARRAENNQQEKLRTIADQNGSTVVPCLEQHVLEVDFRDTVNVGSIKEITQSSICCLEVSDRVHHFLVLLRDPVRGFELVVCNLFNSELNNNVPADPVSGNGECRPLNNRGTKKRKKILTTCGLQKTCCYETGWANHVTYRVRSVLVANDKHIHTLLMLQIGKLGRVQLSSGTNQRDVTSAHILGVSLGQQSLLIQSLVQVLADCTMSSVSPDKDVTVSSGVIAETQHDTLVVLLKGKDFLGHLDLFRRNLLEEHVVQLWPGKQDPIISDSVLLC